MKQGNNEARSALISNHMAMTIAIAARFAGKIRKTLRTDLFSVACVGLLEALDRVGIEHENPRAFINSTIKGQIFEYLRKEFKYLNTVPEETYKEYPDYTKDIQRKIVKTPLQRVLLDLKLQGYKDSEIAEIMGVSQEYIRQERLKIGKRLLGEL